MAEPAPHTDGLVGRMLGDFVVRERIGEGGFGVVYRAEQPLLAREAVVKVLHGQHRTAGGLVQRFLREAKLASKLDHPYAAHVYAFGAEPDGLLWIAMELVRGTPLDKLLSATGPIPLERFVPLLDKLCEVLSTAHDQGIVHRDIKPANVMVLSRAGRLLPKLLDFGIAKVVDEVTAPAAPTASPPIVADTPLSTDATARGAELEETYDAATSTGPAPMLTQAGDVMGSPPYMAPEQWVNARDLGPRTDLYALGALAYEAIVGHVPFRARSMVAMARAHAQQAVPTLGAGLPAALDRVMQRAMAKRPDERYANALELAAAFREAAGFSAEPEDLPRLDELVRDAALGELPQPLAEAVSAYEAARSLHQAYEAIGEICGIAAQYVGLVALAARTRTGSGAGEADATSIGETMRILRRRTLEDVEWVDLARALVRPYRDRAELHPLPELVGLLAGDDPFAPLIELFADRKRPLGDIETRRRIERGLPLVQRLLRVLAPLADYGLAVARGAIAERWAGLRRGKRIAVTLPRPVAAGTVLLLARDGTPVLSLSPLVQVGEPAPGLAEELFFFEGRGRHAARLLARPGGFERGDDDIWTWLRAHAPSDDGEGEVATSEQRAPYRGLSAFTAEDADLFIGREREVDALVNRLRTHWFVAVVGPSGAGKSSFVHAGALPALPEGWKAISLRPGLAPLATLAARLEPLGAAPGLTERLRRAPASLAEALRDAGLAVLVVDQFEEAFTLVADEEERRAFFAALAAVGAVEGGARVLVTLRDDYLMRAEAAPALRPLLERGVTLVGTPSREDLERIVVEPARRAGYELDDPSLPGEMIGAVAGRPGALPLLSFTMSKMWELRDRHFKQLGRKVYDALGGVIGALAQHAEATLGALPAEEQRLVREIFRHLVTAEGTRAVLSRAELGEVLGGAPQAGAVVEKLIAARLLAAGEAEGGDRVEVAHEALLLVWPRLVRWRQEDAEGARLRDQLRAAARQWDERARPSGLLWRDQALAELRVWRLRHGAALTALDAAFADASTAAAERGRRRTRATVVAAFVVLLAGSFALLQLGRRARAGEREASARVAELYEEDGRKALLEGQPQQALVFLSEAYDRGRDNAALHFLVARARAAIAPLRHVLVGHDGEIFSAAFAAHAPWVMTGSADGTARVWSSETGRVLEVLRARGAVRAVAFASDDARAFTVDASGAVIAWDPRDGRATGGFPLRDGLRRAVIDPQARRVAALFDDRVGVWALDGGASLWSLPLARTRERPRFSADGRRLLVVDGSGKALLLDAATGRKIAGYASHYGFGRGDLTADGERVVLPDFDGRVRVYDAGGKLLRTMAAHVLGASAAAFSPDGTRVVTAGYERSVKIWDERGDQVLQLDGHAGAVGDVAFDGADTVISASEDGTVRVWDAQIGRTRTVLHDHAGTAFMLARRGDELVTTGVDSTAKLWSTSRSPRLFTLAHPRPVRDAQYIEAGRRIATTSEDGRLRVWDAATGAPLREIALGVDGTEAIAALSPDGHRVAALRAGGVALWSDPPAGAALTLACPRVRSIRFSADGARLCTVGEGGSAALWDAPDGRRVAVLAGHRDTVFDAAFAGDGRVVTGGSDGTVRLWAADGAPLRTLTAHASDVNAVGFSDDGATVVSAGTENAARVWDAASGAPIASIDGQSSILSSIAIDGDGRIVAIGMNDGTLQLWDGRQGRLLTSLDAHRGTVFSVAFSPDGRRLVSGGGSDLRAFVWDFDRDREPAAALHAWVRCHVSWRLRGSHVESAPIDAAICAGEVR